MWPGSLAAAFQLFPKRCPCFLLSFEAESRNLALLDVEHASVGWVFAASTVRSALRPVAILGSGRQKLYAK